ncbi:MAG: c-type cytochrome [Bacteroidetes bacterium]|nr:c-type cytochrome [Bacteroidota bacterium]
MENQEKPKPESDYDDISYRNESKHKLPFSFIVLALILLAFGVYYIPQYLPGISGWTQEGEFKETMAVYEKKKAAATADTIQYDMYYGVAEAIAAGGTTYAATCSPCHGAAGEGGIGPVLNDAEWLYGGDPKPIYKSIEVGRPKGMPGYKTQFSQDDLLKLTAFVHSLSVKP